MTVGLAATLSGCGAKDDTPERPVTPDTGSPTADAPDAAAEAVPQRRTPPAPGADDVPAPDTPDQPAETASTRRQTPDPGALAPADSTSIRRQPPGADDVPAPADTPDRPADTASIRRQTPGPVTLGAPDALVAPASDFTIVDVYYATDRAATGDTHPAWRFGGNRAVEGRLSYGVAGQSYRRSPDPAIMKP